MKCTELRKQQTRSSWWRRDTDAVLKVAIVILGAIVIVLAAWLVREIPG